MSKEIEDRACPYCKEMVKANAIKCKHCHSSIAPEQPQHEGTCPYCKESINPEAIKCKHCQTMLLAKQGCECLPVQSMESLASPNALSLMQAAVGSGGGLGATCEGICLWKWGFQCLLDGYPPGFCDMMLRLCNAFCKHPPRPSVGI